MCFVRLMCLNNYSFRYLINKKGKKKMLLRRIEPATGQSQKILHSAPNFTITMSLFETWK